MMNNVNMMLSFSDIKKDTQETFNESVKELVSIVKKVSIVTPVYKVEKYIGDCIQSVINQTYPSIEFVLVDDCGGLMHLNGKYWFILLLV